MTYVKNKILYHPDFTVAIGVSPVHSAKAARGVYRRSGISPSPEFYRMYYTSQCYKRKQFCLFPFRKLFLRDHTVDLHQVTAHIFQTCISDQHQHNAEYRCCNH